MVHERSCNSEVVYESPKKKSGSCYRCGRTSHYANECYASTHAKGYSLWHEVSDSSNDESDEDEVVCIDNDSDEDEEESEDEDGDEYDYEDDEDDEDECEDD